jgi:hypothetical protein
MATKLRRLELPLDGPGPHAIVFAPLAAAKPTLAAALDTLRCLAAAPPGHSRVLWMRDWSSFCLNCLGSGKRDDDLKAVAAADALVRAARRAPAAGAPRAAPSAAAALRGCVTRTRRTSAGRRVACLLVVCGSLWRRCARSRLI